MKADMYALILAKRYVWKIIIATGNVQKIATRVRYQIQNFSYYLK